MQHRVKSDFLYIVSWGDNSFSSLYFSFAIMNMYGLSNKREAVPAQGKKPGADGHGACLPVPRPDLWLPL